MSHTVTTETWCDEPGLSDSVDSLRLCEELALQYFAKYPKEPAT